ncbi:hypothetical protein IPM44_01360 [bacterium]|nr:MAG: hypothetical protein IPM44_01360 [bacterium]
MSFLYEVVASTGRATTDPASSSASNSMSLREIGRRRVRRRPLLGRVGRIMCGALSGMLLTAAAQ